ncbi:MAG: hypothetical protein RLZZ453_471 [Chlamydiota bacterium]|jgi:mannose-1-phosphate guanylyltransferase/mannose-6-phosphate isomerase
MKCVILAAGSGTRLWPLSRSTIPKQFLHFGDEETLLQKTVRRFYPEVPIEDLLIMTHQSYYHLVKAQLRSIDPLLEKQIFLEPEKRSTAPAICLAMKYLSEQPNFSKDECILVCPSDHLIGSSSAFLSLLEKAEPLAKQGHHVLFGVQPTYPETGYGYIANEPIVRFIEKPTRELAEEYILSNQYLWNSGIFLFHFDTFQKDLKEVAPSFAALFTLSFQEMHSNYSEFPQTSIDYALLEKSKKNKVLPLNTSWSDIGSWDSVYNLLEKDEQQTAKQGNVISLDTKRCLIIGKKRLVSTIGVEDLIIIETGDAVFVGKRGDSQSVKKIVEALQKQHFKESTEHLTSERPWGSFTVLEEGTRYKIKRILVNPGERLSLQLHYHRSEHWVVVKGTAKVTLGQEEKLLHENESVYVEKSQVHRLENPGKVPLELIEVQVGEYVGEDDIVRLEDIYARV